MLVSTNQKVIYSCENRHFQEMPKGLKEKLNGRGKEDCFQLSGYI